MGAIGTERVTPRPPVVGDDAVEIGSLDWRLSVPVMTVGSSDAGIVYLGESSVSLATVWRVAEDRETRFQWWRLEAKVALPPEADWVSAGDSLIVSEHPYSTNWTQFALFKRSTHDRRSINQMLTATVFPALEDIVKQIDTFDSDFWETGKYLTAGISIPEAPYIPEQHARRTNKQSVLVFGHAGQTDTIIEAVLQEPDVVRILGQTNRGTVKLPTKFAGLEGSEIRLYDELREEGLSLMYQAIRQALAGPHKDSEAWVGRAVSEKAIHIYLGHLHNWNRRIATEKKQLR